MKVTLKNMTILALFGTMLMGRVVADDVEHEIVRVPVGTDDDNEDNLEFGPVGPKVDDDHDDDIVTESVADFTNTVTATAFVPETTTVTNTHSEFASTTVAVVVPSETVTVTESTLVTETTDVTLQHTATETVLVSEEPTETATEVPQEPAVPDNDDDDAESSAQALVYSSFALAGVAGGLLMVM